MASIMRRNTRTARGPFNNKITEAIPELYSGCGFLAISSLVCHLLGMVLRIYTTNVFGDMGNNYFACAYDIYLVVLIATSYCLPGTIARLVAESILNKHPKRAYRIFRAGIVYAMVIGGVFALLLYVGSGFLASSIMATPYAVFSLRLLCIAIFTCGVNSVLKGFAQGLGTMVPGAVSQLADQIVKVIVGLASCSMLLSYGTTVGTVLADIPHYSAAFATTSLSYGIVIGSVVGFLVSMFFLLSYLRPFKRVMAKDRKFDKEPMISLIRTIFIAMLPAIIITMLPNAVNLLSQGIFKKIGDLQGYTADNLSVWWGIYAGKYKLLLGFPISIAFVAAMSNASNVLESVQENNKTKLQKQLTKGVRYTMICSVPCTVWLAVFIPKLIPAVFPGTSSTNTLSASICLTGVAGILFFAYFTVTSAYLHLLGRSMEYIQNCLFAVVIDILLMILLMLFLRLNIYAVVISYMAYAFIMCVLNFASLSGNFGYKQELLYSFLVPLLLSVVSTAISFGVYYWFYDSTENNTASTIVSLFTAAGVYLVFVLFSKCVRPDDLKDSDIGRFCLKFLRRVGIY